MSYMEQRMQEQIEGSLYNDEQKYLENMTKISERKRVTLEFFNQLNEPERSEAIENFDEDFSSFMPENTHDALTFGFEWDRSKEQQKYWEKIWKQLLNNTYYTKPFGIEELLLEMYPEKSDKSNISIVHRIAREEGLVLYNKLKQLGKIKE